MIAHKVKNFFASLILKEPSPHKLAVAFSAGVYIAFSPFPGFHTVMVIFFPGYLSSTFLLCLR